MRSEVKSDKITLMSNETKVSTFISLRDRSDLHLVRKFWHIGMGLLGLSLHFKLQLTPEFTGKTLLVVSFLAFMVETLRMRNEKVNELVLKIMGPFMRECERNSYSGFAFYALGVALSMLFYKENVAILSVIFLIFADPISSLVGVLYGKDQILPNKSLQGTLAGFTTCYLLSFAYCLSHTAPDAKVIAFAFIGGLVGAFSELLSIYADDNLTIPLVSGVGLTIANIVLQVL